MRFAINSKYIFLSVSCICSKFISFLPVSIVMDEAGVDPLLLDDELDLVVEAGLVRGGEGEEGHADVDLRNKYVKRVGEQRQSQIQRDNQKIEGCN